MSIHYGSNLAIECASGMRTVTTRSVMTGGEGGGSDEDDASPTSVIILLMTD